MYLTERRRGHRLAFEARKGLGDADAELRRDDLLDPFVSERLDVVLQPRERLEVRLRQEVRP